MFGKKESAPRAPKVHVPVKKRIGDALEARHTLTTKGLLGVVALSITVGVVGAKGEHVTNVVDTAQASAVAEAPAFDGVCDGPVVTSEIKTGDGLNQIISRENGKVYTVAEYAQIAGMMDPVILQADIEMLSHNNTGSIAGVPTNC